LFAAWIPFKAGKRAFLAVDGAFLGFFGVDSSRWALLLPPVLASATLGEIISMSSWCLWRLYSAFSLA
jgi:hypothetical protein